MFTKNFTTGIRQARLQDKEAVMAFLKETKFFRPGEIDVAEEVFDDAISDDDPEAEYQSFVATETHKTIGWICFGPTPCTVGTFDVYWIAVDPQYQNKGVGTSLMRYAVNTIKNSGGRMIAIDTSSTSRYLPTRRFYEKLGFCPQPPLKDFYSVGDDKIIYIKNV